MARIKDVANYFIYLDDTKEGEGLTNLKIQKLVYYAQGFFLALFDEPLFEKELSAWAHGPVNVHLYHFYKANGSDIIKLEDNFDVSSLELKNKESELIEEVHDVFGQFSAWKLRNMTHDEEPWKKHEFDGGIIPKEDLKKYFKTRLN